MSRPVRGVLALAAKAFVHCTIPTGINRTRPPLHRRIALIRQDLHPIKVNAICQYLWAFAATRVRCYQRNRIRFPVTTCSDYVNRQHPSLREMEETPGFCALTRDAIAWCCDCRLATVDCGLSTFYFRQKRSRSA
jgi:hypothetical protein